ncbi:MAG: hypothetical protein ABI210_06480 [Abditibacteriaceae bacterium]
MKPFNSKSRRTVLSRWTIILFCTVFASLASAHAQDAAPEKVLLETDFAAAASVARDISKDRVTGQMAQPWRDDSSWAKVNVDYKITSEAGRSFQRVQVSKLEEGNAQITAELENAPGDKLYTLQMTLKGTPELPLSFGIRQRGVPYKWDWDSSVLLTNAWQDVDYTFSLPASTQAIGFYFVINGTGTFDIARLRLVETSRDALIKRLEAAHASAPRNLLRQTRFPLGLQSGWWLRAQGNAVSADAEPQAAPDASVIGPSKTPALKITAPQAYQLFAAPFGVPLPFKTHVASVWLKGTGEGNIIVLADNKEIASRHFSLQNADWTRQEIPFVPDLSKKIYALRFDAGPGTLWLDAMQVEAGEHATAYAPQPAGEIALSVPSPSMPQAFTNVQFSDEPSQINWMTSGAAANSVLKLRAFDLYGEAKDLPDVKLSGAFLQSGTLRYDVFAPRNLGAFRIEAHLEGAAHKVLSAPVEVVVNRLRRPRYWMKDAPASPFGVHMLSSAQNILMAKAIGINWTRLHDAGLDYIGWHYLEPQKGQWSFRDAELKRYRKYGIKILGELSTSPQWASYQQDTARKGKDGYFDKFFQPKNLDDYANYVRVVTARYKGVIDAYEVWNEPWIAAWWPVAFDPAASSERQGYQTSREPQKDFVRLMETAYRNAKSVDANLTIGGFNTTTNPLPENHVISGSDWTQGILENGGLQWCDVVTYHQYIGSDASYTNDDVEGDVEKGLQTALGPIIAKLGVVPKPVWMSEGSPVNGLPSALGMYHQTIPVYNTDAVTRDSDRISRYVIALLAGGVQREFLYSMQSHGFFGDDNTWGILVNADNSLNPSGVAHSNLAWHLEDTKFARRLELAPHVYAYLFEGKKRSVAALLKSGESDYMLPRANAKIAFDDLWGNALNGGTKLSDTVVYASASCNAQTLAAMLQAH